MYPVKNSPEFFIFQSDIRQAFRYWIRIFLLSLCTFIEVYAQNITTTFSTANSICFTHLSTQDGLANDKVLSILQDQYGFMWFATENGLSRFDGINFVNYNHSEKNTNSLSSNIVTALSEDVYGNLWVGTQNGLNRYDRTQNNFHRYTTRNGLKNNSIKALHSYS